MATLTIGGKTVFTQSGTDEPVLSSNAVFPAGHVLQIKRSYLKDVFEFTSTVPHNTSTGATGYTFGSAATRAYNTAGQIVDALTTAITKTSATSYFLITYNLNHINNSRMSLGYTFGMCIFSSADNYVTPVDRGNANSNYTNQDRLTDGFWADMAADDYPTLNLSGIIEHNPSVAINTSLTYKVCIDNPYNDAGATLKIGNMKNSSNHVNQYTTVSSVTVSEVQGT